MAKLERIKEKVQKLQPGDFLSLVHSYLQNQNMECPEDCGDFSFVMPTRKIDTYDYGVGLVECFLRIAPVRMIAFSEIRYCVYLSIWPCGSGGFTWYTKESWSNDEARTMYRTIHNHLKTSGWSWGFDESSVEEMDEFFQNNFGFHHNHG